MMKQRAILIGRFKNRYMTTWLHAHFDQYLSERIIYIYIYIEGKNIALLTKKLYSTEVICILFIL
jgi:hypothetical protein